MDQKLSRQWSLLSNDVFGRSISVTQPQKLVPIVRSHLHGVDFYFDLMMSIEYIKMIQNITEV